MDPVLKAAIATRALAEAQAEVNADTQHDYADRIRAIVELEKQRQLAFNKYRTELHQTTELNLADPELYELLQHGDKMRLFFKGKSPSDQYIEFAWYEESDESERGWMVSGMSCVLRYLDNGVYHVNLSNEELVNVATIGRSTDSGLRKTLRDKLKVGLPISVAYPHRPNGSGYYPDITLDSEHGYRKPLLRDVTFITRPINPHVA